MELELDLDFKQHFDPDNFFFGVANAPYLCEGGYNTPDGPKNSYGVLEASGRMEPSGEATRFWTHYEEHIKLAASLGLNAFRMGLDWPRVQPTTRLDRHDPPAWDDAAVAHYARIVACVQRHRMQPIITLHHFTHPAWEGADFWLRDDGPDRLVAYQLRVVEEVNQHLLKTTGEVMRHFLVYNEPNLVPLIYHYANYFPQYQGSEYLLPAFDNLFSRYVRVYDGLYDLFERRGWGQPHVGFTIASLCVYELDKLFADLVGLRANGVARADASPHIAERRTAWYKRITPLAKSKLNDGQFAHYQSYLETIAKALPASGFAKTLEALYSSPRAKKLDYLSINVYDPFSIPKGRPKWWEFAADPEVYRTFILATNETNRALPFYMGENSLAYAQPIGQPAEPRPDGWNRERFLKTYLMQMVRCIKEGVPIKGYLYWSLLDDYEWTAGYTPRLGLYNYDYHNHRILPTDGLGEPAGEIYSTLVAALREGNKEHIQKTFTHQFRKPATTTPNPPAEAAH